MTTSGLNNIGAPSTANGIQYGLHGEMSIIPAEQISIDQYWENDELIYEVKEGMHHSRFYGEDVEFTRRIQTSLGSSPSYSPFYLKYDTTQFPEFTEWKMMRSREYVCGFAPSTNRLEGRKNALQNETVRYLQPLERVDFKIELGIEE